MTAWEKVAYDLVGKPFLWGARGPDAYDCWGLVAEALNRVDLPVPPDLMLPDDTVEHTTRTLEQQIASPAWVLQTKPEPGDVAALSTNKRIHHVGVLTPWGVLHTAARCGAVISRERQLRAMGYQRIEYYRWAG